jgi:hypothetical protein
VVWEENRKARLDVEPRQMLVLLFATALIALILLALTFAGVVVAVVTGIAVLNVFVVIFGALLANRRPPPRTDRWKPKSFPPPQAPQESEDRPPLTIHRL